MSRQITVRLPDALVDFLDEQVKEGLATSRSDLVAKLLRRQQARVRALADLEIIRAHRGEPYPELTGLAELARIPLG